MLFDGLPPECHILREFRSKKVEGQAMVNFFHRSAHVRKGTTVDTQVMMDDEKAICRRKARNHEANEREHSQTTQTTHLRPLRSGTC